MRSLYYKKTKKRLREIDFERIEEIKEGLKMTYREIGSLLGVSEGQVQNYKRCGKLPADRFYALRDAMLISIEEEAREKREQLNNIIFNNSIA